MGESRLGLDVGGDCDEFSAGPDKVMEKGYCFVAVDLSYPSCRVGVHDLPLPIFQRRGMMTDVSASVWKSFVVGHLNQNAVRDLETMDADSRKIVDFEIRMAQFLCLPAILVDLPDTGTRLLSALLDARLGISKPRHFHHHRCPCVWASVNLGSVDAWDRWNDFRAAFPVTKMLGVVLELPADGSMPGPRVCERWLAEPLKCVVVHAESFASTGSLSEAQEKFVKCVFVAGCQAMVRGSGASNEHLKRISAKLLDLYDRRLEDSDFLEVAGKDFVDSLQTPLQPLADNLEAQTYATFEEDPCKYVKYEEAVHDAIVDRRNAGQEPPFVLMVVGAGRGPLVDSAMRASDKSGIPLRLFAVEKNPNAVNVLLRRTETEEKWKNVTVVACDMREWENPQKADILVSELLGSFGDNELSPECLDGAQRFLKQDGVCIPQSYTSYVAPMQSYKLYAEAKEYEGPDGKMLSKIHVVYMKMKRILSDPKPLFSFSHPNWDLTSNDRFERVSFVAQDRAVLHGFAGYFDTVLYKDVVLSIHPQTHSDALISWFSVFIPCSFVGVGRCGVFLLQEPVELQPGDEITFCIWRKSCDVKVWYEYQLTAPKVLPVQNEGGTEAPIFK